ncbi:MAG: TolC family protein, partial [Stenotrophomonas sp.]|nr:TolC family protein [Stenotrophomonas sp.]
MWKCLAALAALAIAPCVNAQVMSPAVPLTLDTAIDRVSRTHPDLRLLPLQQQAARARFDAAGLAPPLV